MRKMLKQAVLKILASLICIAAPASAQLAPPPIPGPAQEVVPPSISLSPAVIMARGSFGQALTQTLTMSNQTGAEMTFVMEAFDEIVKDGKRVFVPAGELPHSVAATAVFSQKKVFVKAHSSASVDVHLTIPQETSVRAVSAMFRGTDVLPSSNAVGMTASLATLITFNLTANVALQPETIRVALPTETSNMNIALWISNTATEPVVPEGLAAVLDSAGKLAGKAAFPSQRLLPGERLEFATDFPDSLNPGTYKILCSFQYEGKTLTTDTTFTIK